MMANSGLRCFGCRRTLQSGERYIKDTIGGYCESTELGAEIDDMLGQALSGSDDGTIIFCENCCEDRPDGRYHYEVLP